MKLLINSTSLAAWYDIIHEAESSCATLLQEDTESYLVFLMMRYSKKPEIVKQIMATEFLHGVNLPAFSRELVLQEVGDKCLLFSGLFPAIAEKRLIRLSYFVQLGQSAYQNISKEKDDLYNKLALHFVSLMDVLQSIRQFSPDNPDLLPLQAYELWNETGSKRALSVLQQYTQDYTPSPGRKMHN